jgi:hypothetical protein
MHRTDPFCRSSASNRSKRARKDWRDLIIASYAVRTMKLRYGQYDSISMHACILDSIDGHVRRALDSRKRGGAIRLRCAIAVHYLHPGSV